MKSIILVLSFLSTAVFCQNRFDVLEGKIIDSQTNLAIPYASIGIEQTSYGTSSNEFGEFALSFQSDLRTRLKKIVISSIGYETARIDLRDSVSIIFLKPLTIELKEVVVFYKNQNPAAIVKKALSRVRKNYHTKPFQYKSFYRHYCKDDTTYGRLIEAAVDIYKRKGYRVFQPTPGHKEEVRVTQLRRSFDNTNVRTTHQPIALYSVMGVDPIAYQSKSAATNLMFDFFLNAYHVSSLKRKLKEYTFDFDGITTYDGQEVYKIKYSKINTLGPTLTDREIGAVYITSDNFAIIRAEYSRSRSGDTTKALTLYKKFNDRYYHHYTMKEGSTFFAKQNFTHTYHLELMTSDIALKDFTRFRGKQPDKEALLKIDYDSLFWKNYNILKATPLQDNIADHLQQNLKLDNQYSDYLNQERKQYFGGKEDEEKFNKFLIGMRGIRPVYITVWESNCEKCPKEMARLKKIFDLYKSRVSFVFLSLDDDIDLWRKSVDKRGLTEPAMKHFRVGSNADVISTFSINQMPQYILVDRAGSFVDLNAKSPADFNLIKDIESLLQEGQK